MASVGAFTLAASCHSERGPRRMYSVTMAQAAASSTVSAYPSPSRRVSSTTSSARRLGCTRPGSANTSRTDIEALLRAGTRWVARLSSQGPIPGAHSRVSRNGSTRGRRSGRAGEIRVWVRTRSGRRAASRTQTAPPSELPTRCTGQYPRSSISSPRAVAIALMEYSPLGGTGEKPNPGRSTASQASAGSSGRSAGTSSPGHAATGSVMDKRYPRGLRPRDPPGPAQALRSRHSGPTEALRFCQNPTCPEHSATAGPWTHPGYFGPARSADGPAGRQLARRLVLVFDAASPLAAAGWPSLLAGSFALPALVRLALLRLRPVPLPSALPSPALPPPTLVLPLAPPRAVPDRRAFVPPSISRRGSFTSAVTSPAWRGDCRAAARLALRASARLVGSAASAWLSGWTTSRPSTFAFTSSCSASR